MTSLVRQQEAYVYGNKLVRPGDRVELLPVSLRDKDKEYGGYTAQQYFDFLRDWLGEGPFTISWIGRWPCGKTMLYLKGAKSDEPGAEASDFMRTN